MGTFERVSLFYGVEHEQVYAALEEFWHQEEHALKQEDVHDVNLDSYAVHERRGDWTVLKSARSSAIFRARGAPTSCWPSSRPWTWTSIIPGAI